MLLTSPLPTARDISGHHIFSSGDEGSAHVFAHRMLDTGQLEPGYRRLEDYLAGHTGRGPRWVHLNWHLAVLAVETGRCERALDLLEGEVLPGVDAGDGLVDGPQLLLRLALSDCPIAADLGWERVASAARAHLGAASGYTELHNLLALAGARDVASLNRWLRDGGSALEPAHVAIVENFVRGLLACLDGDAPLARALLSDTAREVSRVGGSQAQNSVFESLAALTAFSA